MKKDQFSRQRKRLLLFHDGAAGITESNPAQKLITKSQSMKKDQFSRQRKRLLLFHDGAAGIMK